MQRDDNPFLDALNDLDIRIFNAGYGSVDRAWIRDDPPTYFSRLYFICDGEAWLQYGDKRISLRKDHVYFIPMGMKFSQGCEGQMEHVYFHLFARTRYKFDLFESLQDVLCYEIEPGIASGLEAQYRQKKVFHLQAAVYGALARFTDMAGVHCSLCKTYSPAVITAFSYVREHLSAGLRASEVAGALQLSPRSLAARFQTETGRTPTQYIDMCLLQQCLDYLMLTDCPVEEIAQKMGFNASYYFSRFFRRNMEYAPTQFRKIYAGTNQPL